MRGELCVSCDALGGPGFIEPGCAVRTNAAAAAETAAAATAAAGARAPRSLAAGAASAVVPYVPPVFARLDRGKCNAALAS